MKYLQRYLSLLFALVMCVGLFSVTAHAESNKDFSIVYDYQLFHPTQNKKYVQVADTKDNGELFSLTSDWVENVPMDKSMQVRFSATLANKDGSLILKEGQSFDLSMSGLYLAIGYSIGSYTWSKSPDEIYVVLLNSDGTQTWLYDVNWSYASGSQTQTIKLSGTALKDVRKIRIYQKTEQYDQSNYTQDNAQAKLFLGKTDATIALEVEVESKETGVLKGILGKLGDGFTNLGNKLTDVFDSIVELPQKLWNLISDGLKSLFVPSEESMTEYKDKWDELLSSRFGAVYQVVNIITDSWDGIMQADETDTVNFPSATLDFSGTSFSFGGYDVKIVPDGFGVLVTAIKTIVAIVCTVAFVNGLRKRYDEIMGVEQ